ncbi:short-chain fatty acyl-CoA regulator family protein [Planktotalea arctica]|uniref:short-chain fatty acyl-CoA regulator family protein n=1 Tax=Planktotalea arctica TaxID=1481893 RepID=UPI00321A8C11
MGRDTLTGSRIRERRIILGLKQAELARRANVSASYLNLIEHNRRRIGGKLLLDLAAILDVEPAVLSEGAEAALLAALREAAAIQPETGAEIERVEEFAGRFPGWARMIQSLSQRQTSLEQTVVSLTDRMTHDPQLAEALHDVLGAVTAIRATSSILVETEQLEPEWRDRFHRNIDEDAKRLTEGSQALVSYLNGEASDSGHVTTPQDEIEAFFAYHNYYFPQLEALRTDEEAKAGVTDLIDAASGLLVSGSARVQVYALLARYWRDASALELSSILQDISQMGLEPALIAAHREVDLDCVMRRIACLPADMLAPYVRNPRYDIANGGAGLAVCDGSGTLTFRKPLQGFALPRFGAACPLWTLYQALSRPLTALREVVVQSGRDALHFETMACAAPTSRPSFGAVPLLEAHMLIVPLSNAGARREDSRSQPEPRPIGVSCRICPRDACAGRREPSILIGGV